MSDIEIKQTLINWSLIELCNADGNTMEIVVWGVPDGKPSRFKLTSPVQRIDPGDTDESALVHTANSLYRVIGPGHHYRLPLAAVEMLRAGHSPDDVTKFHRPLSDQQSKRTLADRKKFKVGPIVK